MSDRLLTPVDDYLHPVGTATNWNESRYIDFHDTGSGVAGWFRIGMRPNEGHAEMSACINLPDGRTAFAFARAPVDANGMTAGGQEWTVGDPYRVNTVDYAGSLLMLEDPWVVTDPKRAFATAPRVHAAVALRAESDGIGSVMGRDQDHID